MKGTAVFKALGPIDLRNIGRDEMLRWFTLLPVVLALLLRFGLPLAAKHLQANFGLDLAPYSALIMSYLLLGAPAILGMVIGFLLLDERDEGSLIALQVTPLPLRNYVIYRLGLPVALTVLVLVVSLPLAGVTSLSLGETLLVALAAAPLAPLLAVFLAAFASNKIQGFALTKAAGILFIVPAAAYLLGERWQWVFAWLPTFWAPKLFWSVAASQPNDWAVALAGFICQFAWIYLLGRRFSRVLHQ